MEIPKSKAQSKKIESAARMNSKNVPLNFELFALSFLL
jgi:hypothetical protein